MPHDFNQLTQYAKSFSGLTAEYEALLKEIGPEMIPSLKIVTDSFYMQLNTIPETQPYLKDRVDSLRIVHTQWLEGLFSRRFDVAYTEIMYKVGSIHVQVNLPVEFMSGGMTLINNHLIQLSFRLFGSNQAKCVKVLSAINAATGFSLLTMQQSYQEAAIAEELENFLKISGMSRVLFSNLADAYKD
ncbi:MAG: hypothetical protein KAG19_07265 [Methylococcales bacterium]|nr:hypothetical protein [Methylococcales bacterium]